MAEDLEEQLAKWTALMELRNQFVEKLGIYKLDTAKAELVTAVAAGQWTLASIKAQVAQELAAALSRLHRQQHVAARRISRVSRQARDLLKFRSGEGLEPSQATRMWAAYTVFERLVPIAVVHAMIDTDLDTQARAADNYVNLRKPEATCQPPPQEVQNVHALLAWLRRRRYMPKRGSHAYRQVMEAIGNMVGAADTEIKRIAESIRQIEAGTYDTWQPLALAGLPDSIDVKKVIKLGNR
jgi:hypothetical protein